MNFNLKNIQTFEARNGYGMYATLTINNKSVCRMFDEGDGSQPKFEVINERLFKMFEEVVNKLPVTFVGMYGSELKIDKPLFIDILNYCLDSKTEFTLLN